MIIKRKKPQQVMHDAIAHDLLTETPSQIQISQPFRQFPQFIYRA